MSATDKIMIEMERRIEEFADAYVEDVRKGRKLPVVIEELIRSAFKAGCLRTFGHIARLKQKLAS